MARYGTGVQPARYVSQFDPAAEQMTQNILRERSNRFQESFANMQQEKAKIGDMFFLDEDAKQKVLGQLDERKNEILDKYEGDFEAAAPELTKLAVQERSNPIYQLNKIQQQKVAEFNQMRNRIGEGNAIVTKAPEMSLLDEAGNVRSPEDFEYQIFDRSQMFEKGEQHLNSALNPRDMGMYRDPNDPEWMVQQTGVSKAQVNQALNDDNISSFMDDAPEIVALAKSRGYEKPEEQMEFTRQFLRIIAENKEGVYDRKRVQDRNYYDRLKLQRESSRPEASSLNTTGLPVQINQFEELPETKSSYVSSGKSKFSPSLYKMAGPGAVEAYTQYRTEDRLAGTAKTRFANRIDELKKQYPQLADMEYEEAAKAINNAMRRYKAEFGKIHIPPQDFRYAESDNLFSDNGRVGNIMNSTFSVSTEEDGKIIEASSSIGEMLERTNLKGEKESPSDVMKRMSYSGVTFTGDFPGAIIGSALDQNAKKVMLQIEPMDKVKQISFSPWAIAEALRSNGQSLEKIQQFGQAKKQSDGSIIVDNSVPSLQGRGISGFRVKNEMNLDPRTQEYVATPRVSALNSDGEVIPITGKGPNGEDIRTNYIPMDLIVNHTAASLEKSGAFEKED